MLRRNRITTIFMMVCLCLLFVACSADVETVAKSFEDSINNRDYESISSMNLKYEENEEVHNKLTSIIQVEIENTTTAFINEEVSSKEAINHIDALGRAVNDAKYSNSAKNYIDGMVGYNRVKKYGTNKALQKRLALAVVSLSKVIEEDKNYEDAQEKIKESVVILKNNIEKLVKNNDYVDVIDLMDKLIEAEVDPGMIDEKTRILGTRRDELLKEVALEYDDEKDITRIVPKGFRPEYIMDIDNIVGFGTKDINVNKEYSILPGIIIVQDDVYLCFEMGFENGEPIKFKQIRFHADKEVWSYIMSPVDRQTKTLDNGSIAEWYFMPTSAGLSAVTDMSMLGNAKVGKITFCGERDIDIEHILSQEEKDYLSDFIELFKIYVSLKSME